MEIRDLSERALVNLATERKHLTDIIKMLAYHQAESDLLNLPEQRQMIGVLRYDRMSQQTRLCQAALDRA